MKKKVAVERTLSVFSKKTEFQVAEHRFRKFDLGVFKKHFKAGDDDPLMYCSYKVSGSDVKFLTTFLPKAIKFDFKKNDYFVDCSSLK